MLTEKQMAEIKDELHSCERPLFFYHDDADGLCSFLQFYAQIQKGKGVMVKSTPKVDERFYRTVDNYAPDKIFVLDLAILEQEFVDRLNRRIIWLDHHDLSEVKGVKYYNPKQNKKGDNTCISKLSHDIFGENFWIAAVGTIGDWQLPSETRTKIIKEMPDLFDKNVKTPDKALFETRLGKLAKILNFILKGPTAEANKAVKILTRIKDPREILDETSEQGKFLMKKFKSINEKYEIMLREAEKQANDDKLLIYIYQESRISLTGELSNELLYKFPNKIIIITRHHNGDMKTSFRSGKDVNIREVLQKAIVGINGRVGGHDHACGGSIDEKDWDRFIENLREVM